MSLTFVVNGAGTFAAGIDTPPATFTGSFSAVPGPQGIQGIQGPAGPAGPAGAGATITVGSVVTAGPGDPALVTNVGTSQDAIFNFEIPEGVQGAPGVVAATAPLSYNAGTQTVSIDTSGFLLKAGNLSGLADASAARSNLGLGTMATATASDYLSKAGNLSGLASASTARTNLGLGADDSVTFGQLFKGTVAGLQYSINPNDIWAGSYNGVSVTKTSISSSGVTFPDATVQATKGLIPASNLSDLASTSTARTNLGLGTMATETASDYLTKAGNLSGLASNATARTNLDVYSKSESDALVPAASTTAAGKVELATDAEAVAGTSTTLAVTPSGLQAASLGEIVWDVGSNGGGQAGTSGAGASTGQSVGWNKQVVGPTSVVGYANLRYTIAGHYAGSNWNSVFNYNRPMIVEAFLGRNGGTDANSEGWVTIGDGGTVANNAAPDDKSFGFKIVGTDVFGFVHDGTTLSVSGTSVSLGAGYMARCTASSDGAGNVAFSIDGTPFTMTGGPTGTPSTTFRNAVSIKVVNIAALTGSTLTAFLTRLKLKIR